MSHPYANIALMKERRKKQSSALELENTCQEKNLSCKKGWRELGACFQVYFRLRANGHFELLGNIPNSRDIEALCKALAKQLTCELAVQKRFESSYRAWPKAKSEAARQAEGQGDHQGYYLRKGEKSQADSCSKRRPSVKASDSKSESWPELGQTA